MENNLNKNSYKLKLMSLLVLLLSLVSGCSIFSVEEDDPDEDTRWFRDFRIDAWSNIVGDNRGFLAVKNKLETRYQHQAPKIKVDLANAEYSSGNWHYEFVQLAEQALKTEDYMAATGYYTAAAYPQMYNDTRSLELYKLAQATFERGLKKGGYPYKIITTKVDDVNVSAFLVYPQSYQEGDRVPAILESGGIDGLVLFQFSDYLQHWNSADTAWIGFDIGGLGTSKGVLLGRDIDKVHVAIINALKQDNSIDHKNLFIYGRSMGAAAILQLVGSGKAEKLDIGGVVAVCPLTANTVRGGIFQRYMTIHSIPAMTRNALGARFDIDPDNGWQLASAIKELQYSFEDYWGKTVSSVPLLVCTGEHMDFANTGSDLQIAAQISTKGSYVTAKGESGHCPGLKGTLHEVAKFVDAHRR